MTHKQSLASLMLCSVFASGCNTVNIASPEVPPPEKGFRLIDSDDQPYRNQAVSGFFAQVDLDGTLGGDGSGLKVGILEAQSCPDIFAVEVGHEAFSQMQIYHQQEGDPVIDSHPNAVASQFTYFEPGDPIFDGIPGAELYVANFGASSLFGVGCGDPSAYGFHSGVDWLLGNDVRLMNRSSFASSCSSGDSIADATFQDQIARAYGVASNSWTRNC